MEALTSRRALWLVLWSLLWSFSLQQDDTFSFVNPPPEDSAITNPQYTVGADINIQWVGPNDFLSVRLVHVLPDDDYNEFTYVFRNVTNLGGEYIWAIALNGMNLTSSNIFFFNIFIEGETSPRAVTHNFNLTQSSTSTTSAASSTKTTSTSTSDTTFATSSITSSSTATQQNVPTSTSQDNVSTSTSGLSTGAKAGVGVGVSVGALALITAGLLFWRHRRAQGTGARGVPETGQSQGTSYQPVHQGEFYKPPGAATDPSEVPTNYMGSELSGSVPNPQEMADTSGSHL